ncbi:MAG: hypothetical protein J5486_01045, partial [Bacteroidaceae bacterium]|nr:hypothetical protein [Bacteroidaceae bacterium]
NPSFDSNWDGWTYTVSRGNPGIEGGSGNCAEFWNTGTFDIYQEIPTLKDGYWRLEVDALYFPGNSDKIVAALNAADSTLLDNEYFYIKGIGLNNEKKVVAWSDIINGAIEDTEENEELKSAVSGSAKYTTEHFSFVAPISLAGFKTFVAQKRYHNVIDFKYEANMGAIRFGLRLEDDITSGACWCPFDDFKLSYLGNGTHLKFTDRFMTYTPAENISFSYDDPVKAWLVSGYDNNQVIVTRIYTAMAGMGLLLEAEEGTVYDVQPTSDVAAYANLLVGLQNPYQLHPYEDVDGISYRTFTFGYDNEKPGFYVNDNVVNMPACSAYMRIPASVADAIMSAEVKGFGLRFEDNSEGLTTDIENLDNATTDKATWRTLDGRRIGKPTSKGIYMRNGKKVLVK